jgi:7-cyano-7-deazaguanine synthase in queuosine biosynthesis
MEVLCRLGSDRADGPIVNLFKYRVSGRKKATKASEPSVELDEDQNLFTGRDDLWNEYGSLSTIELDLLRVAATAFATDRASKRGDRENLTRKIELEIPVENLDVFSPLTHRIKALLRELSQDIWQIKFVKRAPSKEKTSEEVETEHPAASGRTLLFSGGLDSLAAALEFSEETSQLQLVSHKTRNTVTDSSQKELVDRLRKKGRHLEHIQVFVSSRDKGPTNIEHDAEPSQRTRSFVFLAIGAICARRSGHREIFYMAENGQMAIHLPLTSARIGAFSTRTAHPKVLLQAEQLLSEILSIPLKITNPYVYRTKAEVVSVIQKDFSEGFAISTSCWKNSRVISPGVHHCGECVPCIMRRIAIETTGSDPTAYKRDAFQLSLQDLSPDDDARRNLYDVAEFIELFRSTSQQELLMAFPDLMSKSINAAAAIDMYRRFALEARSILSLYPSMASLLT